MVQLVATNPSSTRRVSWLVAGAGLAGVLDMLLATGFWAIRGVPPERILQSVASGLLGPSAFAGGWGTALFGLALHFLIAGFMVFAYDFAAWRLRWPLRRPWPAGIGYGLLLYVLMTYVVVPLSAAGKGVARLDWTLASVFSHVVLVGIPCALCVRRAHRADPHG